MALKSKTEFFESFNFSAIRNNWIVPGKHWIYTVMASVISTRDSFEPQIKIIGDMTGSNNLWSYLLLTKLIILNTVGQNLWVTKRYSSQKFYFDFSMCHLGRFFWLRWPASRAPQRMLLVLLLEVGATRLYKVRHYYLPSLHGNNP